MSSFTKRSISLPKEMFNEVIAEAALEGRSVSDVLTEATRQWLLVRSRVRSAQPSGQAHAGAGDPNVSLWRQLVDESQRPAGRRSGLPSEAHNAIRSLTGDETA
jgi:hypothetical protein